MLTLKVESTDFDIQACVLRVKGRNVEENQYVKVQCFLCLFSAFMRNAYSVCFFLIGLHHPDSSDIDL